MADAIWPLALPQTPLMRTTRELPQGVAIVSSVDAGPAKMRRRYTQPMRLFPIGLLMTSNQVELLDYFFYQTLLGGTLPFQWKHGRRRDELATYRFLGAKPPEYTAVQVYDAGSEKWRVAFDLELLPVAADDVPPGAACLAMFGTTGTTIWGTDSTISVALRVACQGPTGLYYNQTEIVVVFTWVDPPILDASGQIESVSWEYGASTITYHRDTGWSFDIDFADLPTPSPACTSPDGTAGPASGTENGIDVLNNAEAPADEFWAAKFCSTGAPLDWFQSIQATVDPGSCATNKARATGFHAYTATCPVEV